jgi:hypothetical protein
MKFQDSSAAARGQHDLGSPLSLRKAMISYDRIDLKFGKAQ